MKYKWTHRQHCNICGKKIEVGKVVNFGATAIRERKVKRRNGGVSVVPAEEHDGLYKLQFNNEERYDVYPTQTRIWSVSLCEKCAGKVMNIVEGIKTMTEFDESLAKHKSEAIRLKHEAESIWQIIENGARERELLNGTNPPPHQVYMGMSRDEFVVAYALTRAADAQVDSE